ncbi:MAG: Hsp20/alpha crystallin family protein, partial [Lentisphaerae bacterium]|nr:Hsp20/alpha crystallin family protein [Lentisphaerota bacterium]
ESSGAEIDDLHARVLRVFEEMAAKAGGTGVAFTPDEERLARTRRDILNWQREIDRIFEQAFHQGAWRHLRQPSGLEWGRAAVSPGMRVTEEQDSYHIAVMLPDLEDLEVEMRVQDGVLSITASGSQERYLTRLRLPGAVDAEDIQAHCGQDNILRVRVPKAPAAGVAVWHNAI